MWRRVSGSSASLPWRWTSGATAAPPQPRPAMYRQPQTSVFDPAANRFLEQVANATKERGKPLSFQRALMSGGTCEATVYQEFGYQTAAVCVALGNYHNCGNRHTIRAEYVSAEDLSSMATLLAEAARRLRDFDELAGRLPTRLQGLLQEARVSLARTAAAAGA